MNIAFLLSSFGIKLSEDDVRRLTDLIKSAPEAASDLLARFNAMEQRNIEMHAAIMRLAPSSPIEREFARQLVLFPPAPEGMTHSPEFIERMQAHVRGTESNARDCDAANDTTGGQ